MFLSLHLFLFCSHRAEIADILRKIMGNKLKCEKINICVCEIWQNYLIWIPQGLKKATGFLSSLSTVSGLAELFRWPRTWIRTRGISAGWLWGLGQCLLFLSVEWGLKEHPPIFCGCGQAGAESYTGRDGGNLGPCQLGPHLWSSGKRCQLLSCLISFFITIVQSALMYCISTGPYLEEESASYAVPLSEAERTWRGRGKLDSERRRLTSNLFTAD